MKKKSTFHYSIAEPCHENWGAMTPMEKGRFCDSCAKPVVDFTKMSDRQVVQYMTTATGSVCGRMHKQQLERDFVLYETTPPSMFSLRAVLMGAALSTFSAFPAFSQGRVVPVKGKVAVQPIEPDTTAVPEPTEPMMLGEIAINVEQPVCTPKDSVFSGKVVNFTWDSFLTTVQVTLYDADGNELATTMTNDEGQFEIPLKGIKPFRAVFVKKEYDEEVYFFEELLTTRDLTVSLSSVHEVMMGMMVPIPPPDPEEEGEE